MQNFFIESEIFSSFIPVVFSILTETRNSFKKWPLNLWWTSNKTIMEIGNITKTASFKSFLYLSYKNTQLLLFVTVLFNIFSWDKNYQWFLGVTQKYQLRVSFNIFMQFFSRANTNESYSEYSCICFNSPLVSTQRLHHYLIVKAS